MATAVSIAQRLRHAKVNVSVTRMGVIFFIPDLFGLSLVRSITGQEKEYLSAVSTADIRHLDLADGMIGPVGQRMSTDYLNLDFSVSVILFPIIAPLQRITCE